MDRIDNWLGIRERKGKGPEVKIVVKRASRPRAPRSIPTPTRLLVKVNKATLARLYAFQSRMPAPRSFNTIVDTLLNEALDARFFHLHPGQGRQLPVNYEHIPTLDEIE